MKINFGKVSNDYAKYRDRLPEMLFEQLMQKGITFNNREIIELGAGTGIVSRHLVEYGAKVIGIEPSIELIEEATRMDQQLEVLNIKYINSKAEKFEYDHPVQLIIAVRSWHWFDRLKVLRNLKPAGSNADVVERKMEFPINWFDEWESHSLQLIDAWQQDYMLEFSHEQWCGKIRSVSWLTNESEHSKTIITNELMIQLSKYDTVLQIPHQYSIAILRYSKL